MAWYNEYSKFGFGKYKYCKVCETDDPDYVSWLHHSNYNVYFTQDVLDRLGIENKGKKKLTKDGARLDLA